MTFKIKTRGENIYFQSKLLKKMSCKNIAMWATRSSVVLRKKQDVMPSKLRMVKEDRDRIERKYEDIVTEAVSCTCVS